MKTKIFTFSSLLIAVFGFGQNYWSKSNNVPSENLAQRWVKPKEFAVYTVNLDKIKAQLSKAPERLTSDKGQLVTFPDSDGKYREYVVQEAPVMEPELQAKYPELRSYVGWQKDNTLNTIRFSVTPESGISIMYFDGWDISYLDNFTEDNSKYIIYKRKDLPQNDRIFSCQLENVIDAQSSGPQVMEAPLVSDGLFRKYRLALAATGEYTTYHGGTVAKALAAMVTTMTRVNGVYEKTASLTMSMVKNNDLIIYTNGATDPYTNNNGGTMLGENQTNIDSVIGSANYDIGHVFSTGGGGVAYLGCVCTSSKAGGVTGSGAPKNDPFDIDYVAHEMGHQFGGSHTFNATTGSCGGGNRSLATAFEPGSGSTIMAYAGICGTTNVQSNSDAYFHSASVNQINAVIMRTSDCSAKTPNNNLVPTADAGLDYIIPKGTAFALTGVGTDPNGDALTYLWEQMDNQSSTQPPVATSTTGPLFRTFYPTTSPTRYFPKMVNILANNLTPTWEVIPSVARTLNFSLLVSDEKATGNQSARDMMKVTVTADGPFMVTSHTTNTQYTGGTSTTVTWDVAGTNAGTINTQNVKILLSKNGGTSFDVVLAASVPNNGSASVVLPDEDVASARFMVAAVDNIYFAVNSSNFSIKKTLAVSGTNVKNISIYPNPAKNEINVNSSNKSQSGKYFIYDLAGRLVKSGVLSTDSKISLDRITNGNYILNVELKNGEKLTEKLIIKK